MKIALDVMGGDNAPQSNVIGAKLFLESNSDPNIKVLLVGPEDMIKEQAAIHQLETYASRYEIVDAKDIISMNEIKPAYAFKNKPDSSLVKSIQLVKDGLADAIVSAGNTASLLSSSLFILGKISGIKRAALATYIPSDKGGFVLCDVGANSDVKPIHLVQFAIMSNDYVKYIENIDHPRIALLNIGSEKNKGNKLTTETYPMMEKSLDNFIGNIETRDLLEGKANVVVCDGFTGNAVLKLIEGVIGHIHSAISHLDTNEISNNIEKIFSKYDYEEHGGTPFLGVKGIVMKCHGSCGANSIKNTLISTQILHEKKIIEKMEEDLKSKSDFFIDLELISK